MAQLKDLIVSGATRILGKTYSPEFVGKLTGNADTATKATNDSLNQNIANNYIKNLTISGRTITYTKGNGTVGTLTTQDTNTWRGIVNNLTSDSTTDSLAAAQGKVLKGLVDGKLSLSGGTLTGALHWTSASLPQFSDAPSYLLGIDAFADGGTTKWQSVNRIKVGSASSADVATKLASSAGSANYPIYFSDGKPVQCSHYLQANIKIFTGSLATTGWKNLNGKSGDPSIAIACNNKPANWNSGTYSASLVFGCSDTKGLLDCAYGQPIVTFGGTSYGGATDDNPEWYFKIKGISGQTYTFPSTSKTLCATDGSNASGTWGINISGTASRATLLAPAYSDSTLSTRSSTWRNGVTDGYVVWGQAWEDTRLTSDSGDLTIWIKKVGIATTANMTIDGTIIAVSGFIGSLNGNASTASSATKLSTARTISLTGTVVGSGSFDGSANLSISTSVKDVNNSNTITFAYSKAGVGYNDITWLAAWNGYELRAINKNQFAKASTSGAATSADKLTTARNIALSGYSSGSANFDGSANITITDWGYGYVKYVTQNATTAPYVRVAYTSTTDSYYDASMIFSVDSGYAYGGYGILKVVMRSNDISSVANNSYCEVRWLVRQGFSADQFFVKGNAPKGGTHYADLYFKATDAYQAINIRVLNSGSRGSQSRSWTFDNSAARANPDIRTYTYTNNGYDSSIVSYSTSSGTATNATQLNSKTGSTSATANTYVLRDGNNYVHLNYIESNTKASENPTISQIIVTNSSDNYYRKASLAHLKSSLGSMPASDVYAWAKASTKPSYSWSEITSKPTTFTPSSHNHSQIVTVGDKRDDATTPNSYSNTLIFQGLKTNTKIGTPSGDTYSYVIGLRGWQDSSGGYSHELAFNDSGIFARRGSTTSWNVGWQRVLLNGSTATIPGISLDNNGAYIYGQDNSGNIFFRYRTSSSAGYSYTNVSYLYNNKLGAQSANGYWGMATPSGGTGDWIRTSSVGIIPYQSGGQGSGHCNLGTSSWYFSQIWVDNVRCANFVSSDGWCGNKYFSTDNWIGWYATKGNTSSTRYGYIQTDIAANGSMRFVKEQGGSFAFNTNIYVDWGDVTLSHSTAEQRFRFYHASKNDHTVYLYKGAGGSSGSTTIIGVYDTTDGLVWSYNTSGVLAFSKPIVINSKSYGSTLPSSPVAGQIFFKI